MDDIRSLSISFDVELEFQFIRDKDWEDTCLSEISRNVYGLLRWEHSLGHDYQQWDELLSLLKERWMRTWRDSLAFVFKSNWVYMLIRCVRVVWHKIEYAGLHILRGWYGFYNHVVKNWLKKHKIIFLGATSSLRPDLGYWCPGVGGWRSGATGQSDVYKIWFFF
jgi:hypothetical protein